MQRWSVVVPAKRLDVAKTRLAPLTATLSGGAPAAHRELVLALLGDTVAAALASPAVGLVLVVTDDPRAAAVVTGLGARTVGDGPGRGLNAALEHGARVARADGAGPLAALNSDLPALRSDELAEALAEAAGRPRSFVADTAGTGTTLLAVPAGELDPRFGPGSAAAHAAAGAVSLTGRWPGLRQDVDTPADLAVARRLGVGPQTTGFLSSTVG
ncbi:2-phospho-L-lactate guanylyltransferase [Modestobacter marinus]|uniref:Phosphoenolpyruvate guanylyltransferase n=1 Tax=Modestobacter marinus TaxID=477641 RepID=A0A846LN90_9ACTN|nr:2-phospho-L-lactate guanylyltransferase [Modestobacter marinus]NIH67964.1 2-phospho-L-lactate guanylyltransferase [Modestobacter marinus]GGL69899.1 2-phospho-L-lactate guanylyltransferase [Modestobacter marinus]